MTRRPYLFPLGDPEAFMPRDGRVFAAPADPDAPRIRVSAAVPLSTLSLKLSQ